MNIKVINYTGSDAEDKDAAKKLRNEIILPTLSDPTGELIIDFEDINTSTQSFVHALISKALQDNGEIVLTRIRFINCNESIKRLIAMVTNYSLE
jgi:hypothetical protein